VDVAKLRKLSKRLGGVAPPIAVDYGAGSLKVLQVAGGDVLSLARAAAIDVPEELRNDSAKRLQFQIKALPRLVKAAGFRGKRAVCAIPWSSTFCRHVSVPRAEGSALAFSVREAIGMQLGCASDALVLRHVEVGSVSRSGPGQVEVIGIAALRDLVGKLMDSLRDAGLEPVGIHAQPHALLRAVTDLGADAPKEQAEEPVMYLDIGSGGTRVVVAHGSKMTFARSFDFGGRQMDNWLSSRTGCGPSRARQRRIHASSLYGEADPASHEPSEGATALADPPSAEQPDHNTDVPGKEPNAYERIDLSEAIDTLTDEISMCRRYHQSMFPDRPVRKLVFIGGESRSDALCRHIASALHLPAQIADPLARVARSSTTEAAGLDLTQPQPGWAVPLGLCLSPTDL